MTPSTALPASTTLAKPTQSDAKPNARTTAHLLAWSKAHSRTWNNMQAAWRLTPVGVAPATWASFAALQQASAQKLMEEQRDWLNEWRDWWSTAQQLPRANTLSKVMEQEFNLTLRLVQMFGNRAINWANLQENLEVNYGQWAKQQSLGASGQ
jgi:hypothetical protein